MADFQKPSEGVMSTSKIVRSFWLGKVISATLPPSSSAMSRRDERNDGGV